MRRFLFVSALSPYQAVVELDLCDARDLPQIWYEKIVSADMILVLETEAEPKKVSEPKRVTLHVVKNRGGEKGKVVFDFLRAFAKFVEVIAS